MYRRHSHFYYYQIIPQIFFPHKNAFKLIPSERKEIKHLFVIYAVFNLRKKKKRKSLTVLYPNLNNMYIKAFFLLWSCFIGSLFMTWPYCSCTRQMNVFLPVSTTSINCDYRLKYCMPHYLFIALNISQRYFSFLLCYFVLMKVKDCRKPCKQSKALSFFHHEMAWGVS